MTTAIVAFGLMSAQEQPVQSGLPKGLLEISRLKQDFNKDQGRVRLMFIFSPS